MIMSLIQDIKELKATIGKQVDLRLSQFVSFQNKESKEWFSELCFCILTANSKASTAMAIQKELGADGFIYKSRHQLVDCIRRNKHRFHNNKTRFILSARKFLDVRDILRQYSTSADKRDWLVKNIKGIGYKEASHFLRNTGHFNVAILDRHILNLLLENGYLRERPKVLNRKIYLELENVLQDIADKLKMTQAELDMYMWYLKTQKVLK